MELVTAENLLHNFYQISGFGVALIDRNGHCLADFETQDGFCRMLGRSRKCLDTCTASDREAFDTAERTRSTQCYLCPFGLRETVVPVYLNGDVAAFLIAETGIDADSSDDIPFCKALEKDEYLNPDQLRKMIARLPHVAAERLAAVRELLEFYADYIEKNDLLPDPDRELGQIIKHYLRKNFTRRITLPEISRDLHCSTVTLTQTFRRTFGMSIMTYVTQKRMKLASRLLENTDDSVSEISENCGFSDAEYFSRCFKSFYGESPSSYRKNRSDAKNDSAH